MATKIQLSNFDYINRSKAELGEAVRFTFALSIDFPGDRKAEFAMEGCLLYYKYNGELIWSPPMNKIGIQNRQLHWINPVLYSLVLDAIQAQPALWKRLQNKRAKLMAKVPHKRLKDYVKPDPVSPEVPKVLEVRDDAEPEAVE